MRSGDEPANARSPLRARRALAIFGIVTSLVAAVIVARVAPVWVVVLFLGFAVVAAIDLVVILRHQRQGPHYQPGHGIPAYRPAERSDPPRPAQPPTPEHIRMRRYFAIMGSCLFLIVMAWSWVRLLSTTAAVVMSAIAAVLPPTAVIIANFGVDLPPEPTSPTPPAGPGGAGVPSGDGRSGGAAGGSGSVGPGRRPLGWQPRNSPDDGPR